MGPGQHAEGCRRGPQSRHRGGDEDAARTDRVVAQGLIPIGSNAADFAAFQAAEIAQFSRMIKDANSKIGN